MTNDHLAPLLQVEGLRVALPVQQEARTVLRDVSFALQSGQTLGLVGESGSGKSMTARAIARLLPAGAQLEGSIRFAGSDVTTLSGRALRTYRTDVAVIFQDPRAHINPVRRIGDFLTEALRTNLSVRSREAHERAEHMLTEVGIDRPGRRLRQYPHELSGGMLQRVMIAAALLTSPKLLLADEPTTALDVTTQSEVMAILGDLRRQYDMAMVFITHDLELAAAVCDQTAVMYAGEIVEINSSNRLHEQPLHPYTAALMAARPSIERTEERLRAIPGRPLSGFEAPVGQCAYAGRCRFVADECLATAPGLARLATGQSRCMRIPQLLDTIGAGR